MYALGILNNQSRYTPHFENARKRARRNRMLSSLFGRSNRLLHLDEYAGTDQVVGQHTLGIRSVPIRQIKGTENRLNDFDNQFNPIRRHNKSRWINIYAARARDQSLPAVELIKIGETYFVRDGHHRISVALALKAEYIDANVTELIVMEK